MMFSPQTVKRKKETGKGKKKKRKITLQLQVHSNSAPLPYRSNWKCKEKSSFISECVRHILYHTIEGAQIVKYLFIFSLHVF